MAIRKAKKGFFTRLLTPQGKEWLKAFLIALIFIIVIRFFVFDLHSISGNGMENTLLPGDVVIVTRYNYGVRMPMRIFPQSWVNIFFSTDSLTPVKQLPYWRLPGNEKPEHQHLILLNIPAPHNRSIDQRTRVAKRLVALPGETIKLEKGEIFVNGQPLEDTGELKWNYLLEFRRGAKVEDFVSKYNIKEGFRARGQNRYVFSFTRSLADSLGRNPDVRRIERERAEVEKGFYSPFGPAAESWTADDFGPVTIPFKGYTIDFDTIVPGKYLYHITYHERNPAFLRNDSVFINDQYATSYTFRYNYYFFMGDNRHNTSDSRLWGMVPESHIAGKASRVLISFDKEASLLRKLRWHRTFQSFE